MEDINIKYISLFAGLDESVLERIWRVAVKQLFKKNKMIVFEDEPETKIFIILSGMVKITRISEDGREFIFSFLGDGDFFGELSLLEEELSSTNAVAVEDSELIYIQREDYLKIFAEIPQISFNLLREMTQRLRVRDAQIKSLSLQDATGKVASTILRFADNSGNINMGQVELPFLPPHRDIANMVGTSRETISRALNWLEAKGYLHKERGHLIIRDYENFRAAFNA